MFNPIQATDFYKVGHIAMYPQGTEEIYSNMTARSNRLAPVHPLTGKPVDFVVNVGLQQAIAIINDSFEQNFFARDRDEVVAEYQKRCDVALGPGLVNAEHIGKLHDLGFLPVVIKALPEGAKVPFGVPLFTIRNTLSEFFWLTNYLETILSNMTWHTITVATIAAIYDDVLRHYAKETGSPLDFVPWQAHDFSYRGMSGWEGFANIGHMVPFFGTDTIPALCNIEKYYFGEETFLGGSVPATEHSVMCAGGKETEIETFRRLINQYPTGIISIVSDTWDFWKVLTDYAVQLKSEIEARQPNGLGIAKVVFRPDSGDPVKIVCGYKWVYQSSIDEVGVTEWYDTHGSSIEVVKTKDGKYRFIDWVYNSYDVYPDAYTLNEELSEAEVKGAIEILWDNFGGTVNEAGYKVLNPRVGLIYGDSITLSRMNQILRELKEKGFASCNMVFGVGSYTYQYVTRDTLGFAVKATSKIDHTDGIVPLYKEPLTGDGTKKSARGLLRVEKKDGKYVLLQEQEVHEEEQGCLEEVFKDGAMMISYGWDTVRKNYQES